jgi:CheY-like chemotaxis protein
MELDERKFSLRGLLGDITSTFNPQAADKSLRFTVAIDPDIPNELFGDDMRLRQVLVNLIANSLKFTGVGSVSVEADFLGENEGKAKIRFRVIDTGIGIPEDKKHLLFKSFSQADSSTTRKYGGTGLGTAICKQLVELMGGEIGVESKPGVGSTFWFIVPFEKGLIDREKEIEPSESSEVPIDSLKNAKVLVVEDYQTNQEIAKFLIEGAGGIVTIAENGLVALEMVKKINYDIILMDVQMPKMDGYETTKAIRKLPGGERILIIGMTANVFEKDKQACLAAGMNDFIPKPIILDQLLGTVAIWLSPDDLAGVEQVSQAPATPVSPKDASPVIDIGAYVDRMGGNREIAIAIIKGFTGLLPGQLKVIREAIEKNDIATVDREAHSIKGGASNVFANDLMLAAKELEMHAKSGSLDRAVELLEEIGKKATLLVDFVDTMP